MRSRICTGRRARRLRTALAAAAVSTLVLTGCSAATGAGGVSPTSSGPQDTPAQVAAPGTVPSSTGPSAPVPGAAGDSPSTAARMACSDETRENIAKVLSLAEPPKPTDTWANRLYTCTYTLPAGSLVLAVQESTDAPSARAQFDALQHNTPSAVPIQGLTNLGLPAFETGDGLVVFAKDNMTLTVEATKLTATVGPHGVTRGAFAYQVATAVLACWAEHPPAGS
ncbi:hypothetical protein BJG92_02866 [Arthrobacter sp. SO5]|uniref:hypothetical protein n=1 Tax=Arthrobacter sp. SO5 TaxID=1897055 RepID=UPI001E4D4187|nr:hypothetical protein [Arthrobacter sp. SO5]MCB5275318.1 hypothetical protein [Arthrobacter sp. SO5]